MSNPDGSWMAETQRRMRINEGCDLARYRDSMGIWTLGIGCNLERGDAVDLLRSCGISYSAVMAGASITQAQADHLFALCFAPIIGAASTSLGPNVFRTLSDARRFVICDLEYNLGENGWLGFSTTRSLITEAQNCKNSGQAQSAHNLFELAADHLASSAWAGQVGDRARRDIAMIRTGEWVDPNGNGA